jgi:hypothetical protein
LVIIFFPFSDRYNKIRQLLANWPGSSRDYK